MPETQNVPITLEQFEGTVNAMGNQALLIPFDPKGGRQKDKGAKLKYTGYVILFQYEDAAMPGKVYTANPTLWHTEPSKALFQASENLEIVNGVVGRKTNLLGQLLEHFGEVKPLLGVLQALGKLTPLLAALVPGLADLNPVNFLTQFLGRRKSIPGKEAAKQLNAKATETF